MRRFVFLFLLLFPLSVFAGESSGFITRTLWVTPEQFFAGDVVRLYAGVFNDFDEKLLGQVEFFDNNERIGSSDFTLEKGGRAGSVWIDWEAKEGTHVIRADLVNTRLADSSGERTTTLKTTSTEIELSFIDQDTDQDGLGNIEDADDDNDGVVDVVEIDAGSDPLNPDDVPAMSVTEAEVKEPSYLSGEGLIENIAYEIRDKKSLLENTRTNKKDFDAIKSIGKAVKKSQGAPTVFEAMRDASIGMASLLGKGSLGAVLFLFENKVAGWIAVFVLALLIARRMRRRKRRRRR